MVLENFTGGLAGLRKASTGHNLVISRTPLRVSFVGGGTDIAAYYRTHGGGAVVNAAIDKYVHIIVNPKFDGRVRVSYSQTENVETAEEVRHPLVREALKLLGIRNGVEIVSVSDIASTGTGLGSSSAFLVGLLHALHAWLGEKVTPRILAEESVKIEREIVGDPGGKQDQYIAAFGGLQFMAFHPDDRVDVYPIRVPREVRERLERSLLLFYTGNGRNGAPILKGQIDRMALNGEYYDQMRQLAYDLCRDLEAGHVDRLGEYLHRNWVCKRSLHQGISTPAIDETYERARAAGALGGKITGAGGGGFLLLFAPLEVHEAIRSAVSGLREESVRFEEVGSRILYSDASSGGLG